MNEFHEAIQPLIRRSAVSYTGPGRYSLEVDVETDPTPDIVASGVDPRDPETYAALEAWVDAVHPLNYRLASLTGKSYGGEQPEWDEWADRGSEWEDMPTVMSAIVKRLEES